MRRCVCDPGRVEAYKYVKASKTGIVITHSSEIKNKGEGQLSGQIP